MHGNTKLTREQALEIRASWLSHGPAAASLAVRYNVGRETVRNVLRGVHPTVRDLPSLIGQQNRRANPMSPFEHPVDRPGPARGTR